MEQKRHITVNKTVFAQVWKHWSSSFKKSTWELIGVFTFFSLAMVLDLLIKPLFWKEVFNGLVDHKDIWGYYWFALATTIAAFLFSRMGDFTILLAETRIIRNLKEYILKGLLEKSMQFFTDHSSGGLVAKSKRFAAVSEQVIDEVVLSIIRSVFLVIYLFFFTLSIIPALTGVFIVWMVIFITVIVFFSRMRLKFDLQSSNADSLTTGYLSDTLLSVFTLRIFSFVPEQLARFGLLIQDEEQKRRKSWFIGNAQWAIQSLLVIVFEFVCLGTVLKGIESGTYKPGMFMLLQSYILSLSMYMWGLGRSLVKVRSAFADAYEMAELLDHESTEPINLGEAFVPKYYGIELKKVSFGYDTEQPILHNFSFSFEPGRSYGVIGKTGSGKSTLMKLVMKFYNADKGVITVGGRNIESIHKNTLRSLISFVPQIPIFPSITMREVIALGNPSATEQEIISAAKKACCDFIWEKTLGLDTVIGERGIKLSGGEAQRLAIAAAILKDAPIIVMDEPTSALDAVTERAIQNALNTSFKGKTMIVIAHRLSTVAVLDEIILLEHGEIVDHGSHNKLLVSSQAYSEAWELQTNPQIFVHE